MFYICYNSFHGVLPQVTVQHFRIFYPFCVIKYSIFPDILDCT